MGRVRISPHSPSNGSHIGDFCPRLHEFGKEACSRGAHLDVGARWKWAHRATSRLYLGTWLTTIRDTIRSSRAIPRLSSSSSREKIKNIGRRVMLRVARVDKSACHRRARALALPSRVMPALEAARARARLLRAVQGCGQRVLAMRTRAWPALEAARLALRLLRVGEAHRPLARRVGTLRAAQVRRYRRRVLPTAAKRQVERLPPCRRPLRARRGPYLRSLPCRRPSLSPCSLVRTARRTTS